MENINLNNCLIENINHINLDDYKGVESTLSVQEFLGISNDLLNTYYEVSNQLLAEKRFVEASDAFMFLTFLNPLYSNFWLGLGISEQSQEHYQAATLAYLNTIQTSPNNPAPYANLAQCLLALDEKEPLQMIIERGLELCAENSDYNPIKENLIILQTSIGIE